MFVTFYIKIIIIVWDLGIYGVLVLTSQILHPRGYLIEFCICKKKSYSSFILLLRIFKYSFATLQIKVRKKLLQTFGETLFFLSTTNKIIFQEECGLLAFSKEKQSINQFFMKYLSNALELFKLKRSKNVKSCKIINSFFLATLK